MLPFNTRVREESEEKRESLARLVQLDLLALKVPLEMMAPKEAPYVDFPFRSQHLFDFTQSLQLHKKVTLHLLISRVQVDSLETLVPLESPVHPYVFYQSDAKLCMDHSVLYAFEAVQHR